MCCSACDKAILEANQFLNLNQIDSHQPLKIFAESVYKLEKHVAHARHCLIVSILPSKPLQKLHGVLNHFDDVVLRQPDGETSFIPKPKRSSTPGTTVCVCHHPASRVLSTGRLYECRSGESRCNGYFHRGCCDGGYPRADANQKPLLLLVFPSRGDNDAPMGELPSLRSTSRCPEVNGLISQIEALVAYYHNWPKGRRSELCNPVNDKSSTRNEDKSNSALNGATSIDECDRMRIALAPHVAKMYKFDECLLDYVCRFVRYFWALPFSDERHSSHPSDRHEQFDSASLDDAAPFKNKLSGNFKAMPQASSWRDSSKLSRRMHKKNLNQS